MPIVTRDSFAKVVDRLSSELFLGVDTETYGVKFHDKLFSVIIANLTEEFYFNFQHYDNLDPKFILPNNLKENLKVVFSNPNQTVWAHNAKFDLERLEKEGIEIKGTIVCSLVNERIIDNELYPESKLSLESTAERRLGASKDASVEEWIDKAKLFDIIQVPGKKKKEKDKHFELVPFEMITSYGMKDGRLHYDVGKWQKDALDEMEKTHPETEFHKGVSFVRNNEARLIRTCTAMEKVGIQINREFTAKALKEESDFTHDLRASFCELTGLVFNDGSKCLTEAFKKLGLQVPLTEKGNPSFNADVLESLDNPVADIVNRIRKIEKRVGTYYSSFLYYADSSDVIHPNMKQAGTETGRFSYSKPNLQNVPKEDEEEDQLKKYHIRECFKPRDGFCFVMIDYQQQEFRMLLDYAGEKKLIEDVMSGADPHQATAELCGISRKHAKTVGFATLYGIGLELLAKKLGVSVQEADEIRSAFFGRLPKVKALIRKVPQSALRKDFIMNWAGRVLRITDPNFAYKKINHLIQSGCADVVKVAMNDIQRNVIKKSKSAMLLQVHDELVFEMHPEDFGLLPHIKQIMESVYPTRNGMVLTTSIEHSWDGWGFRQKTKGEPVWKRNAQGTLSQHQMPTPSLLV